MLCSRRGVQRKMKDGFLMERIDILGVGIDNVTMEEAVERAMELLTDGKRHYVVTPNAEILYECGRDAAVMEAVKNADLILPDGAGVVLASKILGTPLKEKVAGVEFAVNILPKLVEAKKKLYLLGSKPGIAERAAIKMRELAPGLEICGTHDGYFKDDTPVIEEINRSGADVLYVCLGAPRQEFWIRQNIESLCAGLCVGLGGTLDSITGEVKRAPKIFIKLNLEWFYRLIKQPSRLGRMMRLPKFLMQVFKYKRK